MKNKNNGKCYVESMEWGKINDIIRRERKIKFVKNYLINNIKMLLEELLLISDLIY